MKSKGFKRLFLLFVSALTVVLVLSGCFLFNSQPSSNLSYFPFRTGQSDLISFNISSTQQATADITYSSGQFNGHNDLVITPSATYIPTGFLKLYFWKNSNGQVYWDGVTTSLTTSQGSLTSTTVYSNFKLLNDTNSEPSESPTTLTVVATYCDTYPSTYTQVATLVRTSKIVPSITIQNQTYTDVLRVTFASTGSSPLEVYFAKGVGMIRVKIPNPIGTSSQQSILTIDLVKENVNAQTSSNYYVNQSTSLKNFQNFLFMKNAEK